MSWIPRLLLIVRRMEFVSSNQEASVPQAGCIATCQGISALLRCSIDGYVIKCCLFMQRMHGLWASITLQWLPAATEVLVALQAGS